MGRKTALIRSAWTTALIAQVVIYILCFPRLMAVVASNRIPWNPVVIVAGLDVSGLLLWGLCLFFIEAQTYRSKWMQSLGIGAFVLLALCLVITNLNA
jgi:hypothetical protein